MTEQEHRADALRRRSGLEFERRTGNPAGIPVLAFVVYLALAAFFCGWVMGKASPLAQTAARGAR